MKSMFNSLYKNPLLFLCFLFLVGTVVVLSFYILYKKQLQLTLKECNHNEKEGFTMLGSTYYRPILRNGRITITNFFSQWSQFIQTKFTRFKPLKI